MLGLSVNRFWQMRPKLPFRFKVEFFTGNEQLNTMLGISLTNVTLPKIEGQAGEGSLYLGNTIYTIPVWKIGSRKLEITFEETDKMVISKFIDRDLYLSYGQSPYRISIGIHQFDENLYYSTKQNDPYKDKSQYQSTLYICHLSSYSEPQFKRSGNANQVTMTATFIIDAEIRNWDGTSNIVIGQVNANEISEYNQQITEFGEAYDANYKSRYKGEHNGNGKSNAIYGLNIKSKAAKKKDKNGKAVASVWNAFRYNAQTKKDAGKLRNLMENENSWMSMAFNRELTVGEQKKILKEKYGLTDADFKNTETLTSAMQRLEEENQKRGGKQGEIWGTYYGCSGAVGWAALMVTQKEDYVMPQDMVTKGGNSTGDFMTVVETEHPELFGEVKSGKFKTQAEAEAWITANSQTGSIIAMAAKDKKGNSRGHRAIRKNKGYVSDHEQAEGDAIPNCYESEFSVSIRTLKV